jgi:hypothetical protein
MACSSSGNPGFDDNGSKGAASTDAATADIGLGTSTPGAGSGGPGIVLVDGRAPSPGGSGVCKAGLYEGTFDGSYTSYLTGVGVPIPVTGNVELTLDQAGAAGQQCQLDGEFKDCSTVFALKNGVITGVADALQLGDASTGGFPYFCTMTGTLDCNNKALVDGWIQCTYCVGPLDDGGMSCSLPIVGGSNDGVGGYFAGPLTADYDVSALAFVNGTWNGAEALAGNDGGSPGPDGAPISDFLSDSGLYLGPGNFGGSGTWNAAYAADH